METINLEKNSFPVAFAELENSIQTALETYSNVHRGSGHKSIVTTQLYENARDIILKFLELDKNKYVVVFCTPLRADALLKQLVPGSYQIISCQDIGLSLGVRAIAVKKKALPKGAPFQTGGGTTRLISKEWIVWADGPDRFEAGTPAIINIIAFARALTLIEQYGKEIFLNREAEKLSASEILHHDELERYSGKNLLYNLRLTMIGKGLTVPTVEGIKPFINLDNSASTPTFAPIWKAFKQSWHQTGQTKKEIINEVKSICADMLGAPLTVYEVIFASNATEAINIAAGSISRESDADNEPVIMNTLLEHSSNDLPWRMIQGYTLIRLSVNAEGYVDLNELESFLSEYNEKHSFGKKRIKMVAISGASNVLGVCNNLKEISTIVHRYGAHLLVDGAQMAAHRKVDIEGSGIDYFAFSAHKIYAPFGCGVLLARKGLLKYKPAEIELIKVSGEENIGGIAALGKALVLMQRIGMELIREDEQSLTKHLMNGMHKIKGLRIYGIQNPDSPVFSNKVGVIVFSLKGMISSTLAEELALQRGIGIRFGCHCSHILIKHLLNIPPFLQKFQKLLATLFPGLRFPGLARVSLGIENSQDDIDTLLNILGKIAGQPNSTINTQSQKQVPDLPKSVVKKQINDFAKAISIRVYGK